MKYRVTLTKDAEQIGNLKRKGALPFLCGGVPFSEDTVHECDDISIFACDPRYPGLVPTDPRLVVELTNEVTRGEYPES